MKYLVRWKSFTAEHNTWKKKINLENAKEVVVTFEKRLNTEVKRQENKNGVEDRDFRRGELPEKYMTKILYISELKIVDLIYFYFFSNF